MSIHNLIDKIKGEIGIKNITFIYLIIIIGVGISAFGLGRFSVLDSHNSQLDNFDTKKTEAIEDKQVNNDLNSSATQNLLGEKMYVASKNGKMYYTKGCGGASRIKPENEVWFNSVDEAVKAGYTLSTLCK